LGRAQYNFNLALVLIVACVLTAAVLGVALYRRRKKPNNTIEKIQAIEREARSRLGQ
jgi:hypothetical protein